jgi:hypothetical protein
MDAPVPAIAPVILAPPDTVHLKFAFGSELVIPIFVIPPEQKFWLETDVFTSIQIKLNLIEFEIGCVPTGCVIALM